ncbi:MAG: prolipoprotein diacylglyceryl transferase [Lachnospiraceae bacterium]|nr:prolipoprotein diacylglyceryl transferase [Lachnospiraceae bacterium]
MDIEFPNLGIYLKGVPKTIHLFGSFTIAYYGVIIAIGICLGILLAAHLAKKYGGNPDVVWDFAIYAVIFSIVGARIYYVIFSWDYYKYDILSIFNLRNGGIAIYGAVIGAFTTLFVYCRVKKISPLKLGDYCVPGLALGQAIGRWGNFMNREAFGEYTDNLFAMRLPVNIVRVRDISENIAAHMEEGADFIQVHPTFLYESMWNFALLILLLVWWKHKKFNGEIILMYLGGYGLGRLWIEGLRTDQLLFPGTSVAVSQVLAGVLVVFAVVCETAVLLKRKKSAVAEK